MTAVLHERATGDAMSTVSRIIPVDGASPHEPHVGRHRAESGSQFRLRIIGSSAISGEEGAPVIHVMSFPEYRKRCDRIANIFRKVGILEAAEYEGAIRDPRTIFVFWGLGGVAVPAIVPIDYEHGYDAARSESLTGLPTGVFVLPTTEISKGILRDGNAIGGEALPDDYAVIVAGPNPTGEGVLGEDDLKVLSPLGNVESGFFIHEGLRGKKENESAWMGLYRMNIKPAIKPRRSIWHRIFGRHKTLTFDEAWAEHRAEHDLDALPGAASTGTYLFTGEQLTQNRDILEKLWTITEKGFGNDVLGAFHPVSMEEGGKKAFEEMATAPSTYTAVHYVDGKPVCFGSMTLDIRNWPWINTQATSIIDSEWRARKEGAQQVFFSALISSEEGKAHSLKLLGLFYELAGRTGKRTQAIFESTNLSSIYVPKIAELCVKRSKFVELVGGVELIDKIDYEYVKVSRRRTK